VRFTKENMFNKVFEIYFCEAKTSEVFFRKIKETKNVKNKK
jgi:hypothetical protein